MGLLDWAHGKNGRPAHATRACAILILPLVLLFTPVGAFAQIEPVRTRKPQVYVERIQVVGGERLPLVFGDILADEIRDELHALAGYEAITVRHLLSEELEEMLLIEELPFESADACMREVASAYGYTARIFGRVEVMQSGFLIRLFYQDRPLLDSIADNSTRTWQIAVNGGHEALLDAAREMVHILLQQDLRDPERIDREAWVGGGGRVIVNPRWHGRSPLLVQAPFSSEPEGAWVVLDGRLLGRTPFTRAIPHGQYFRLRMYLEGHHNLELKNWRAAQQDSGPTRVHHQFVGSTGWLKVEAKIPCEVTVDGQPVGRTPLSGVRVEGGLHVVRLRAVGLKAEPHKEMIYISPDGMQTFVTLPETVWARWSSNGGRLKAPNP